MSKYDINLRKWVLLLLPTFHRRPLLTAWAFSLIAPLRSVYVIFLALRNDTDYRLHHNGQVCFLRAIINDEFDAGQRRITISDYTKTTTAGKLVYMREVDSETIITEREAMTPLIINRRGFVGVSGCDFMVNIPEVLKDNIDEVKLRAIINKYKLVSKRYIINYI